MSYKIVGKYIKDLSFKIPNSRAFSLLTKDISNYKINIDIKSNQLKENIIEVEITLKLVPIKEGLEIINTKIIYSSIIQLDDKNIDKKKLEKIILIEVPTKVYSDLRKVFVFVFESSGFKEIKISDNVDFEKLYNLKKN